MTNNEELLSKIRKAIQNSGFPLEMSVSKLLNTLKWDYHLNIFYNDFESNKLREIDIYAEKIINGINVNLIIECKSSKDTQLILYEPEELLNPKKSSLYPLSIIKSVPTIDIAKTIEVKNPIIDELSKILSYQPSPPISKNIIFTKGDKINQDNKSFFSSLESVCKYFISNTDIQNNTFNPVNNRELYFFILLWDGYMAKLTNSEDDDFTIEESSHGQYENVFNIYNSAEFSSLNIEHRLFEINQEKFGTHYLFDIIKYSYFEAFLKSLEISINNIQLSNISSWGIPYE